MSDTSVPVIDIESLVKTSARRHETVAEIGAACHDWGFFQITGHAVPEDLASRVWRETTRFFALPLDAKQAVSRSKDNARGWYNRELTKNTRDMKEVFDFGHKTHPELPDDDPVNRTRDGFNQWPDAALDPAFRSTMWEYFRACERVALTLLEAVGESLGVSPACLTRDFASGHTSFLRLNYYSTRDPLSIAQHASATGHLGVHHHTDAGALTVLLQDNVGGLQVFRDEKWFPVEPLAGALVINIGDIVQVWSNDRYRAPAHRVLASRDRDRYSLPFFFNPSYDAEYAPLPALTNETSPPRYRPINWGQFRWQRQQGDYADYGTENQISDYRIPGIGD